MTVEGFISYITDFRCQARNIRTYAVALREGQEIPYYFRDYNDRIQRTAFELDEIVNDSTVRILYDSKYVYASGGIEDTLTEPIVTVAKTDVHFNTHTIDAGTLYHIRIDTTYSFLDTISIECLPTILETTEQEDPFHWENHVESHYENGQVHEKYVSRFNEYWFWSKDGLYQKWDSSGQLLVETTYDHGKRNGKYMEWHENGRLKAKGEYRKRSEPFRDLLHGKWSWWDENGELVERGWFYRGSGTIWYANGNKKSQQFYKDEKKVGVWREWYPNGNLKKEYLCRNGAPFFPQREWYENGNLKSEKVRFNDKDNFIRYTWYDNGQPESKYMYAHLKWGGYDAQCYPDGRPKSTTIKVLKTLWYKKDCKKAELYIDWATEERFFKEWYPSGTLKYEGDVKEDKKCGIWTKWAEDGTKLYEREWLSSRTSFITYFHPNGIPSATGKLKREERKGIWQFWDEEGVLIREEEY